MKQYDESTEWVVKSSSQILGPYTTEDVFELIKKKSIIPIDEIIPEGGHWAYVRDVSFFQSALLSQASSSGIEDTKTQNVSGLTDDMTSTELLDDTEELSHVGHIDKTNPNPKILPIRSENLPKPSTEAFVRAKARPPAKRSSSLIRLLLLLLVIAGVLGYQNQDLILSEIVKFNSPHVIKTAQERLEVGDYKEAYKRYQEMNQLDGVKSSVKGFDVQFAALVLNQERQTVYARDLLEQANPEIRKTPEWLTVMGLSYLIDQNYNEAHKYLSQSISLNPDFLPAWVNLGHLNLNQGKFQEAWSFFYSAYIRGYSEGHVTAFMALTLIEQWRVNRDGSLLRKAYELISNFLSTSADRRYLNQILKIWLEQKIGQKTSTSIGAEVLSFIETDPYVASKFKQNVYELGFDNKKFESYCSEIQKGMSPDQLHSLLFKSMCYFQLGFVGGLSEATIARAEELYPKETLVFAVKSVILANADEDYQKSLLIGRALSSDADSKYILPLILQARFCEQKNDISCTAKYWNNVYERNKLEIGSYAGMSKYFKHKNDLDNLNKWVSNGRLLSPSYRPLIELDY